MSVWRTNLGGMLGAGVYFAESAGRSDQYVRGAGPEYQMLVYRVLLGDPECVGEWQRGRRREGCREAGCSSAVCAHPRHDSLIYQRPRKYREFVIYNGALCYPELIVTYRRELLE